MPSLCTLLAFATVGTQALADDPSPNKLTRAARKGVEISTGFFAHTLGGPRGAYSAETPGASIVRETREFEVPAGTSTWQWTEVPDTALSETMLVSLEGTGAKLTSHRIVEALPGPSGFDAMLHGQSVRARPLALDPLDTGAGKRSQVTGSIVSLESGVVLRVGEQLTVLPRSELTLVDGTKAILRKQVEFEVSAATPGTVRVTLSALVPNLQIRPVSYVLEVDETAKRARLVGHAALINHAGVHLDGARLFLAQPSYQPFVPQPERWQQTPPSATWTAFTGAPRPYPVATPLSFAGADVADVLLIDESMPFSEGTRAMLGNLSELREPTDDVLRTPVRRVWLLPTSGLNLPVGLPGGGAYVTAQAQGGATSILGQAYLSHAAGTAISVEGNAPGLALESRRLTKGGVGECAATVRWEHTLPLAALQQGPFELELPYAKSRVEAVVGKAEGVTLVQSAGSSKVVVAALPASARGATDPRKFVVTYKTNPCK